MTFFAIGVSTIGATGLPVTFSNVNAKETNGSVLVNWSNLTESDVNFYEVERSTDGRNFTAIGKVQPKGNDYGKWDYSFTDANPARTNYYRVKAVEFGNSTRSSVILKVSSERTANAFVVYPNPVQNKVVTLQANNIAAGAYSVTIVNSNGQQVFAKTMNFQAGSVSQSIELPSSVKPGMYMLRIENAGTKSVTSLFVQ
ncbi:MAG: T9SS type A sorting domain-containing protein [Chitinophagaceae bacterium]|nr:T9SS type A sorting domain-containing protein [Chitinophagaceae bacterium]